MPNVGRWWTMRQAAQTPFANNIDFADQILDKALNTLGAGESGESFWDQHVSAALRNLVRPEEFQKPYTHECLSEMEVAAALKRQAVDSMLAVPPDSEFQKLLVDSCMARSGEAEIHAMAVVEIAVTYLAIALRLNTPAMTPAAHSATYQKIGDVEGFLHERLGDLPVDSGAMAAGHASTANSDASSNPWPRQTRCGVRRGSMENYSNLGSTSANPRSRVKCPNLATAQAQVGKPSWSHIVTRSHQKSSSSYGPHL